MITEVVEKIVLLDGSDMPIQIKPSLVVDSNYEAAVWGLMDGYTCIGRSTFGPTVNGVQNFTVWFVKE